MVMEGIVKGFSGFIFINFNKNYSQIENGQSLLHKAGKS